MKNKLRKVLLILMLALLFGTGCGKAAEESTESETAEIPASIFIWRREYTVEKGTSTLLGMHVDYGTTGGTLQYKSSDEAVALVTDNAVEAKGCGTCEITVSLGDIEETVTVNVYERCKAETVRMHLHDAGSFPLFPGETVSDLEITYAQAGIVSVSEDGAIVSEAPGRVHVTAHNGTVSFYEVDVTVLEPLRATTPADSIVLSVGNTGPVYYTLFNQSPEEKERIISDNPALVLISEEFSSQGMAEVMGKGVGETTLKLTCDDKELLAWKAFVFDVKSSKDYFVLKPGEQVQLDYTVFGDTEGHELSFKSLNEDIVSVDRTGLVQVGENIGNVGGTVVYLTIDGTEVFTWGIEFSR